MEKVICQSCAMPLENEEDFGTNRDGSASGDYCKYCYENGEFSQPDQTMEEMIATCVPFMMEGPDGMPEAKARKMMEEVLPQLKRWKQ